jgi:uncharacterized membrane protein YoaK (UPF0700 family)
VVLLALAFAGGSVDAGAYLGLAHVFPANMTGNTVLLAIALARGTGSDASRAGVALAGFCVGVAVGTVALQSTGGWPRTAAFTFALEAIALSALLAAWAALGPRPRLALIAAAGGAMGAQSAGVRVSQARGVNTTYVTGTLTAAVAHMVSRLPGAPAQTRGDPSLPGATWIVYGLGALAGGFAVKSWSAAEMAIPLGLVLASTVLALGSSRTKDR